MRAVLLGALFAASVSGQGDKWKIEMPKADNTVGLAAPRLLRTEEPGQSQRLKITWRDDVTKRGGAPVTANIELDTKLSIVGRAKVLRTFELALEDFRATVGGQEVKPKLDSPRFSGRMIPTGRLEGYLEAHGIGPLTDVLQRPCVQLLPSVPLREYEVGEVLDLPVLDFARELHLPEGTTTTGKVYVQMPQALYRAGRQATIVTTFLISIEGDDIPMPSGTRIKGELRVMGRREATYKDIMTGGYLASLTLEMETQYIQYENIQRASLSVKTRATVEGQPWSAPAGEPELEATDAEELARLRWNFRSQHTYPLRWRRTVQRPDAEPRTETRSATLTVGQLERGRAPFVTTLNGGALSGSLTDRGIVLPATLPAALREMSPILPNASTIGFKKPVDVPMDEFLALGILRTKGGKVEGKVTRTAERRFYYLVILTLTFDVVVTGDRLELPDGVTGAGTVRVQGTRELRLFMDGQVSLTGIIYVNRSTSDLTRTVALGDVEYTEKETEVFEGRYPDPTEE